MRRGLHIFVAILAAGVLIVSCSRAKVIPRRTFVKIYADMFLADEWVKDNPGLRRQVDTSLIYEPIFNAYGYTTDDYLKSVEHYMGDTERYARMLKKAGDILDAKGNSIRRLEESINLRDERLREIGRRREQMMAKFSPDSVWKGGYLVQVDSNLEVFFIRRPSDTIFIGPGFIIDTVAVDSLKLDSLKVDSLKVDSLKVDSLKAESVKVDSQKIDKPLEAKPVNNRHIAADSINEDLE